MKDLGSLTYDDGRLPPTGDSSTSSFLRSSIACHGGTDSPADSTRFVVRRMTPSPSPVQHNETGARFCPGGLGARFPLSRRCGVQLMYRRSTSSTYSQPRQLLQSLSEILVTSDGASLHRNS